MHDISVVIPVLNEIHAIKANMTHFKDIESSCREIIFVDGGSNDGSKEYLEWHFSQVCTAPMGRATQMNVGAKQACGKSVLFLHVDTVLPFNKINENLADAHWGFFCVKLSGRNWTFRFIEKGINFRSKVFRVGTGDQCLFFNRFEFLQLGGFPNQALMEDIEISRIYKRKWKPYIENSPATTSSRRWEKHGVFKVILLMWSLQLLYKLGVSPERLAHWYGYRKPS